MGKIIYLISFLKNLKIIMFLAIVILLGVCGYLVFLISESKEDMAWYLKSYGSIKDYDERIKSAKQELERNTKKFKIAAVFLLFCVLVTMLIPSREEMYTIALVRDYEVQDVYKMSKSELKISIDYFFDKVDELGK